MADTHPPLMTMLTTQMRYMSQRQTVLAQNIANIDTPGYQSKDLKKLDFANLASSASTPLAMTSTAPNHLSGSGASANAFEVTRLQGNPEQSPNGNTVVLEDEMAKTSDTNTKFQESALLMKKYTQMLHESLGH